MLDVVLDFETTNLDKGDAQNPDNRIVLTCGYTDVLKSLYSGTIQSAEFLNPLLEGRTLVAHNAKFELKWLKRMGYNLQDVTVWDTMVAEYVFSGNRGHALDLGSVAQRYGLPGKEQFVDKCIKGGVCPSEIPRSFIIRRCEYDVLVTKELYKLQYQRAIDEGKLDVIRTRCMFTPVLADIEFNGMVPDPDKVLPVYYEIQDMHLKVKDELSNLHPDVNWNSPKQVSELLYDVLGFKELHKRGKPVRTPKDGRKADASTIGALTARTKAQKRLKQLVLDEAALSTKLTFLNKLKDCCENEKILYANFNQCITQTHRLSSNGTKYKVQFQNMAREYKPLFKSRNPKWLIGEIDGAQLEFRVAAFMGQDEAAISDIRNEVDVHRFTASTITEAGQVTSRQEAKAHTFKPLYGGSSGTEAEKAYYAAFKEKYKGIASTQQEWIDTVVRDKKLRIPSGLEFYWDNCRMGRDGYVTNSSNICNYPVQSFATADIIPIAVRFLWEAMKEANLQSFIVNTVHDSVILEVHPDEVEIIIELGVDSFTTKVYNYLHDVYKLDFNVPLGVGYKFGEHWSLGEEVKINVEPV